MIDWGDIVLLILSCVLSNHMGLISAIEETVHRKLPIVNCIKCLTFWSVLFYCLFNSYGVFASIAISFLSSYLAIWLELFFGFIDVRYEKIFNSIYKDSETSTAADSDNTDTSHTKSALS